MKSQITFAQNVRKSTTLFAEALIAVGVRVTRVQRAGRFDMRTAVTTTADAIRIKGVGKFDVHLVCDYTAGHFEVQVKSKRGTQMQTTIANHNEFQALLKVWNVASY